MAKQKVGFIGQGNVAKALSAGLERAGHAVRLVGKDPAGVHDVAGWADVVVLAVPFRAIDDALNAAGNALDGKTLVDATNALDANMNLAVGFTTSGAEELQRKAPGARVVKAFNTVFAANMETGSAGGQPITALVVGDDTAAKSAVLQLARDIGFDPVDAGPLKNARLLEPMAHLNIQLGYVLGLGPRIGFKLVRG